MILALALAATPIAAPERVFACSFGAKRVDVTLSGGTFTYRFGRPGKPELTIAASGARGNLFYLIQRYASIEIQMRFANGDHSYVLYSMPRSEIADTSPISGLVVFKGKERIADMPCKRFAEFTGGYEARHALPEDSEDYSAM